MNYNLFHNLFGRCLFFLGFIQMTWTSSKDSNKARLSLVCWSLGHIVVNTVKLTASQFNKINRQSFSDFKLYAAVKLRWCGEKSIPPFEVRFGTVKGRLMLFNIIETDKLQFVILVKCLVFDLTEVPFLKCLISTYCLIGEVLNDQNVFIQNRIWVVGFRVVSSFIQVVISQNELQLLGRVEKWITLKVITLWVF